jgi:hypothetical protein
MAFIMKDDTEKDLTKETGARLLRRYHQESRRMAQSVVRDDKELVALETELLARITPGPRPQPCMAYVLGHVDITPVPGQPKPVIRYAGVYSSEHITQDLSERLVVLLKGYGNDFEEGIAHIHEQLQPHPTGHPRLDVNGWLRALLTPATLEQVQATAARVASRKAGG